MFVYIFFTKSEEYHLITILFVSLSLPLSTEIKYIPDGNEVKSRVPSWNESNDNTLIPNKLYIATE